MTRHLSGYPETEVVARKYCEAKELRYLSHEYYYHSNGCYNALWIAVEDYSGRCEVRLNLNDYKLNDDLTLEHIAGATND